MTGVKNFFIYWPGKHNLGPGRQFQQIYQPENPPGASHRGTWTGRISGILFQNRWSNEKSVVLSGTSFLKKMIRLYVTISRIYSYFLPVVGIYFEHI